MKIKIGLLIFILLLLPIGLHGQTEQWMYRYNGPANNYDVANSVVYGLDGNIYAVGYSYDYGTNDNFIVISLTSAGDTNWVYRYNGPGNGIDWANSVIYGVDGNIYAVGYSQGIGTGSDFTVISLTSIGTERWVYRYNGPGNDADQASSVVYGTDGNIYTAGYSQGIGTGSDFTVISLTNTGTERWVYRYNAPTNFGDGASSVVYGLDGNIYTAGYSQGIGTGYDFAVIGLTNTGTERWVYRYNGSENSSDAANSIVYGLDGNIYTAGYSTDSTTGPDFTVIGLTNTGSQRWIYRYNGIGSGGDVANSIVYGLDGNIYTAGSSKGSGSDYDFMVIGLTNVGSQRWIYRYNGPGNSTDRANSVIYADGNIYTAGYSKGSGTGYDFTVIGLTNTGTERWVYRYNGMGNGSDQANSMVYGVDGIIYTAGYSQGTGTANDFTVICIDGILPPAIPVLMAPADSAILNDTTVTFQWHPSTDPQGLPLTYVLYYIREELKSCDPMFDTLVTQDTSVTMVLRNTHYLWKVKARNSSHDGNYSALRSFDFDFVTPNTPILFNPINGSLLLDTLVAFQWGAVDFREGPPAPVRYILQIDSNNTFNMPIVDETLTVTTVEFDLIGDAFYYWRVKAYDLAGNQGSYAATWHFGIDITPPLIDSTTVLDNTASSGPFGVYSKVTDIFGIDSVRLYFKRMEDPDWFYYDMAAGGNWYFKEIPAVSLPEDTVKYYIWAKDNAERLSVDPSAGYFWFIANYQPGIQDFTDRPMTFSFGLESNPVVKDKALFNLALPQDVFITLKIYDVLGRLVNKVSGHKSAGYYQIPWTVSNNAGVYFYTFESPGHKENGKLVLIR